MLIIYTTFTEQNNKDMKKKLIRFKDNYIIAIHLSRVSRMFKDAGKIEYHCTIYYNSSRYCHGLGIIHPIIDSLTSTDKKEIKEFIKINLDN